MGTFGYEVPFVPERENFRLQGQGSVRMIPFPRGETLAARSFLFEGSKWKFIFLKHALFENFA